MTLEVFLANLDASHLLSEEQLARVRAGFDPVRNPTTPPHLAQSLVQQGLLTRWQAQMLLAGRHAFFLGRYRLTDQIGRGGMGTVFKAEQVTLRRVVAIKVMADKFLNDAPTVARFRQEIHAAAALSHPNIVHAYDADCVNRTHFLVMEYVEGHDLETIVKRTGALPVGTACEYVRQAAEGLQHAHERGMAHRDIKPSNLLLATGETGTPPVVKILDMGLARLASGIAEEAGLTQTGQIMGTPDYIPPEQAMDTKQADIRSDIYSLGCTLFRLLTGRVPFLGNSVMEKLMARAAGEPPRVKSLVAGLPAELDAIVAKMMAREPGQRYQTPAEVVQALAPFARWEPSVFLTPVAPAVAMAAPSGSSGPAPPRAPAAAMEAVPLPAVDSAMAILFEQLATESAEEEQAGTSTSKLKPATALTPGGKHRQARIERREKAGRRQFLLLIAGLLVCAAGAVGSWLWNRAGETRLSVEWPEAERAKGELEVDGRPVRISRGDLTFPGRPGKRTLRLTRDGFLPLEETWELKRGETKVFRPDWKPTPDTIRFLKAAELGREVDDLLRGPDKSLAQSASVLSGKIMEYRREWPGTPESLTAAALLARLPWPVDALRREEIPPEELKAAGHGDPEAAPTNLVAVLGDSRLAHGSRVNALAFSPDGKLLASGGDDRLIKLWDPVTGRSTRALSGSGAGIHSLAFLLDGKTLISAGRSALSWDVEPGADRGAPPTTLLESMELVTVSPDGKIWAFAFSPEPLESVILLIDSERREELRRLTGHTQGISKLAFRGDGRILASSSLDATVRLWDVTTGKPLHVLHHSADRVKGVAFPKSGNQLATSSDDGTIKLWDSETGQELKKLTGHHSHVYCVAFGKSADTLASGDANGLVILWDVRAATPRHTWAARRSVDAVAFAPDDALLATGDSLGAVRLYRVDSGEEQGPPAGNRAAIDSLAVNPDGKGVVSIAYDQVRTWDVVLRKDEGILPVVVGPPNSLMFSPDGRALMVATRNAPPRFFEWPSRKLVRELPFLLENFWTELSPDGRWVAAAQGGMRKVRLQDAQSGKLIREFGPTEGHLYYVTFSPDGRSLAAGGLVERIARIWNVATGRVQRSIPVPHDIGGVRFSPDGKLLCVYSPQFPMKLFDVKSGREMPLLVDNLYAIASVDFTPDGTLLAASCGDRLVRIWSLSDGALKESFQFAIPGSLESPPRAIAFTPDGRHLLVGTPYGTIHVLRLRAWSNPPESRK